MAAEEEGRPQPKLKWRDPQTHYIMTGSPEWRSATKAERRVVIEAFATNKKMTTVSMSDSDIDDDLARSWATVLAQPTCIIESLTLESNPLSSAGIEAIASALPSNQSLTELRLRNLHGRVSKHAEEVLGAALEKNTRITMLYIDLKSFKAQDLFVRYLTRNEMARREKRGWGAELSRRATPGGLWDPNWKSQRGEKGHIGGARVINTGLGKHVSQARELWESFVTGRKKTPRTAGADGWAAARAGLASRAIFEPEELAKVDLDAKQAALPFVSFSDVTMDAARKAAAMRAGLLGRKEEERRTEEVVDGRQPDGGGGRGDGGDEARRGGQGRGGARGEAASERGRLEAAARVAPSALVDARAQRRGAAVGEVSGVVDFFCMGLKKCASHRRHGQARAFKWCPQPCCAAPQRLLAFHRARRSCGAHSARSHQLSAISLPLALTRQRRRVAVKSWVEFYSGLIAEYPLRANAAISGGLCAIGDVLAQMIELRLGVGNRSADHAGRRMLAYGSFVCGPLLYGWYSTLRLGEAVSVSHVPLFGSRVATMLPWLGSLQKEVSEGILSPTKLLIGKVAADGLFFQAPFLNLYFATMGLLEGLAPSEIYKKTKDSFHRAWGLSLIVWTPIQVLNLSLVPTSLQPAVVSAVNVGWKATLSLLNAMHDTSEKEGGALRRRASAQAQLNLEMDLASTQQALSASVGEVQTLRSENQSLKAEVTELRITSSRSGRRRRTSWQRPKVVVVRRRSR